MTATPDPQPDATPDPQPDTTAHPQPDATPDPQPYSQHQYQVRFEWGAAGALGIGAGADVIVWVDVLAGDLRGAATNGPVFGAIPHATVIAGSLRNRRAVAEWVLAAQGVKGDRVTVAVVAAGEVRDDGSLRFALEDLLGSGAIIDALADLGIDYCSPEAAAASASFTGLRNAIGHLIGSSGTGQQLRANGRADAIERAIDLDRSQDVMVLRECERTP